MIEPRGLASLRVDRGRERITDAQRAAFELADVHVCLAQLLRVAHDEPRAASHELSLVADLAAALGVERRGVEHHLPFFARAQFRHRLPAAKQRDDLAFAAFAFVTLEERPPFHLHVATQVDAELAGRACPRTLRIHRRLEACLVEREPLFAGDVVGEIHREAVRVVQAEHRLARDFLAAHLADRVVEQRHALRQRLGEALFFLADHALDVRALRMQLRIRRAHLLLERRHQRVEERLALAEHEAVADRAAHDPAQHVAAAFVRGLHAVRDQEGQRADVVGDDLQRVRTEIRGARRTGRGLDQIAEQVDVVVAVHALHHGGDALEAHAGIDRRLRQRRSSCRRPRGRTA